VPRAITECRSARSFRRSERGLGTCLARHSIVPSIVISSPIGSTATACASGSFRSLAKKAVGGDPEPPIQNGDGVYSDWVIVALHGIQAYLGHPYHRSMDFLHEMSGVVEKFDLTVSELPDSRQSVPANRTSRYEFDGCYCGYLPSCKNPVRFRPST